eukprot:753434-Hanusia_phi.AAC.3
MVKEEEEEEEEEIGGDWGKRISDLLCDDGADSLSSLLHLADAASSLQLDPAPLRCRHHKFVHPLLPGRSELLVRTGDRDAPGYSCLLQLPRAREDVERGAEDDSADVLRRRDEE